MTEPLWLRTPSPRTCLANVGGTRGNGFVLDKTIFSPGGSEYRHPQPADRGEVWIGGDKRTLRRVAWNRGEVVHTLEGAVPARGAAVRCHLDVERREAVEAAHVAMHLVLSGLSRQKNLALSGSAHVQGGGFFAFDVARESFRPETVAEVLREVSRVASRGTPVEILHAPLDGLHGVDPQGQGRDAFPGPETTLRLVRIGDASTLPCDGTFPASTAGLGRIVLSSARTAGDRATLQLRVIGAR